MKKDNYDIVAIGGSAGSMPVITDLVNALPSGFQTPVVIIIHRLRNVQSEMTRLISEKRRLTEPEDKEFIAPGKIYLAPQNYHLLLEEDKSFALDYSELVNYSRPSIDIGFQSMANLYQNRTLAILLSGANKDGAKGLAAVIKNGGTAIVQEPEAAEFSAMPEAAIQLNEAALRFSTQKMIQFIVECCK